jgi:hypothetical protein
LDNFAIQKVSVSNEQHQVLVQLQEPAVYVLSFCPGHVSDLASILGTNIGKVVISLVVIVDVALASVNSRKTMIYLLRDLRV